MNKKKVHLGKRFPVYSWEAWPATPVLLLCSSEDEHGYSGFNFDFHTDAAETASRCRWTDKQPVRETKHVMQTARKSD